MELVPSAFEVVETEIQVVFVLGYARGRSLRAHNPLPLVADWMPHDCVQLSSFSDVNINLIFRAHKYMQPQAKYSAG
jgi:hypothetical protein